MLIGGFAAVKSPSYVFMILGAGMMRKTLPQTVTLDRDVGIIILLYFVFGFIGCQLSCILLDKYGKKALEVLRTPWTYLSPFLLRFHQFESICFKRNIN